MPMNYEQALLEFKARTSPSKWTGLGRTEVAGRLLEIIDNPDIVQQGKLLLCGPAAFLHCWVFRDPASVVQFAIQLFENGSSRIGTYNVKPCKDLLNCDYSALDWHGTPCPQAEWMIMSALKDQENSLVDYQGTPEEWFASICGPWALIKWMDSTGLYRHIDNNTATIPIDFPFIDLYGADDVRRLRPDAETDVIMMTNTNLIAVRYSIPAATHYIVLRAVATPVSNDKILMKYFSWGDVHKEEISNSRFDDYYYGAVIGYAKAPRPKRAKLPAKPVISHDECTYADPVVTVCWKSPSQDDTGYEVERSIGSPPGYFNTSMISADNPSTLGASFTDRVPAGINDRAIYKVRACNTKGKSEWSDEWSVQIGVRNLAAFFTSESIFLARIGGYANPARNRIEQNVHQSWASAQYAQTIIDDLADKHGIQLGNQSGPTGNKLSKAAWYFAETAIRLVQYGVPFDNFYEESANSMDFEAHRKWALFTLSNPRQDSGVPDELEKRIRVLCSYVLADKINLLKMIVVSESAHLLETTWWRPDPPLFGTITFDQYNTHTAEGLRDTLIKKYNTEVERFTAMGPSQRYRLFEFYADLCLRLNSFGVDFGSITGNSLDANVHRRWAATPLQLKDALALRMRRLTEELMAPDIPDPLPETKARWQDNNGQMQEGPTLAFPPIRAGKAVSGWISFVNVGAGQYEVSNPMLTGAFNTGNTQIKIDSRFATLLSPAELELTFASQQPGSFMGTIEVHTTAPGHACTSVPLTVKVLGPVVEVAPEQLSFGACKVNDKHAALYKGISRAIMIKNRGNSDVCNANLFIVDGDPPGQFQRRVSDWPSIAPGKSVSTTVSFVPMISGEAHGILVLEFDDGFGLQQRKEIRMVGRGVLPHINALPCPLDFGLVPKGETRKMTVLIENDGEAELELCAVRISESGLTPFWGLEPDGKMWSEKTFASPPQSKTLPPHKTETVTIAYESQRPGLSSSDVLVITSDDPEHKSLEIPLKGASPGQEIAAYPGDGIYFGTNPTNRFRNLVVQNAGTVPLALKCVRLGQYVIATGNPTDNVRPAPAKDFAVRQTPQPLPTLAVGATLTIQVEFLSSSPGIYRNILVIESNAIEHPALSLNLDATIE